MGRAKVVTYYNERYRGSLTELQCEALEEVISLSESHGSMSAFKHIIMDIPESDVMSYIEDMEMFNFPMHSVRRNIGTLDDFQTLGVAFMVASRQCILGDSVGLGKTVELAGTMNCLKSRFEASGKSFRYLALTEKNVVHQFRKEMVRFTGDFVQLIQSGEQKVIMDFQDRNIYTEELSHSVVGTHALLTAPLFIQWLEQCRTMGKGFPFDALIIDESSVLGGKGRQIISGYNAIRKHFSYIYFLNATPFETNAGVFYNQLSLLDSSYLPTKENFTKEYCIMDYRGMYRKPTGRYKNQERFKRLVGYRYFARTREDNGAVMEDCDGRIIISDLSPIQKEWIQKSQLKRMVYDCPSYIDSSIEFNSENVPKLASIAQLFQDELKDADSVIIYSNYKESQKYLSEWFDKQGISNRVLNGETSKKDRQRIISDFQQGGVYRVLITNVQKGLNFGSCDYCIFYGFDPNPSRMIQFEGRITRSFDIIGKHVYILCSKGEEYKTLMEVVKQRARATSQFTNTDFSVVMSILLEGADGDGR